MKKVALVGGLVAVGFLTVQSMGGIVNTKHNLSSTSTNDIRAATGETDQLCVFCHTPHNANNATFTVVPLWNKDTPSGSGYTMYDSPTLGGAIDSSPAGPSLACLSCHDGTSAINSVYNPPGDVPGPSYILMVGQTTPGPFSMPDGPANIGTDLTNDHPISIVYTVGNASLRPTTATLNGEWIIKGEKKTGATVADLLRDGKVECVSCHDPHVDEAEGFPLFLRTTTDASNLCLGCHDK